MPGPISGLRFAHAAILQEVADLERDVAAIADDASARAVLARLEFFAGIMKDHNDAEEVALFPALEEKAPGSGEAYLHDHRGDNELFAELILLAKQVVEGDHGASLARLRRGIVGLVERTRSHVDKENTLVVPRLEATLSPPEQGAVFGKMMAHLAPGMPRTFGWMVRQLPPPMRVEFLGGLQKAMPPERFAGMVALARAGLPSGDWAALTAALPGLPA